MNLQIQSITVERLHDNDPDTSYLEQDGFEDRNERYQNDDFYFIGIRASMEVVISGTVQTLQSGGLWGIESDSDKDYLEQIKFDEAASLRDVYTAIGGTIEAFDEALSENGFS